MSEAGRSVSPVFAPDTPGSTQDAKAYEEALAFQSGSLEELKARRENERFQRFRQVLNYGAMALLVLVVACLAMGILVYTWHLLAPTQWHFLADAQRSKLETVLATALLSSALANYAQRQMT